MSGVSTSHQALGTRLLMVLWLGVGLLLIADLGREPVQRTQEARVLETAREMLGSGWRGWLIPHLAGEVRLKKPPLAYWMAAGAFKLLGVSEVSGRLPFAVLGWLLVGLTYATGRRLTNERAAFFSAAALAASYLFFRHARLAETDGPSALFVTAGVYGLWRGASSAGRQSVGWFHLSSVAIALAALSKGPPAAFPIVFLLAWVAAERNWRLLRRWALSGAPLTLVVLAGPWFAYALWNPGGQIIGDELRVAATGVNHPRPFYFYLPELLRAMAPWSGLLVIAIAAAAAKWRDPRVRILLIWSASIFVPLCVIGNKQYHYLVPMAPALAVLVGWWIDRWLAGAEEDSWARASRGVFNAMLWALALAAPAIPLVARLARGQVIGADFVVAAIVAAAAVAALAIYRQHGIRAGIMGFAAASLLVLFVLVGTWGPSLAIATPRSVAARIRDLFGDGPYCFYGENASLPLSFNLRAVVPQVPSAAKQQRIEALFTHPWLGSAARDWAMWGLAVGELGRAADARPDLTVIAQTKNDVSPPPLPAGFVLHLTLPTREDQVFRVYHR